MRFLTGDDTGIVKQIRVEAQKVEKLGPQRKGDAVERLCWAGPVGNREARFVVAHASGTLELRDAANGQVLASQPGPGPSIRGLEPVGADSMLVVSSGGNANVVAKWCSDTGPLSSDGGEGDASSSSQSFQLPSPVADARLDPCNGQRFAFGGDGNNVKIFDLQGGQVTWKAKSQTEDFLCLAAKMRISAVQWGTPLAPARDLLLCGTIDGKVRIYDAKAQRRPLFELQIGFGAAKAQAVTQGSMTTLPAP